MDTRKTHVKAVASLYDDLVTKILETMKDVESASNIHVGLFNNEQESLLVAQQRVTEELIEPLDLDENKKILDVGCGVGLPAIKICEKYHCEIEGITISHQQIEISKKLLQKIPFADKLNFTQMDAHHITFADGYFNAVYALESMAHMDRQVVLKELNRVLSSGGKLAICDFYMRKPLTIEEEKEIKENFHTSLLNLDELKEMLLNLGFKDVAVKDWSQRAHPTYKHWEALCQNLINIFPKDEAESYRTKLLSFLKLYTEKAGYFMLSAEKPW